MKKFLVLFSFIVLAASCKKDETPTPTTSPFIGTWKVTQLDLGTGYLDPTDPIVVAAAKLLNPALTDFPATTVTFKADGTCTATGILSTAIVGSGTYKTSATGLITVALAGVDVYTFEVISVSATTIEMKVTILSAPTVALKVKATKQ